MKLKKMKPVRLWAFVHGRSGACGWGLLYKTRAAARATKERNWMAEYRIARVEIREVTK